MSEVPQERAGRYVRAIEIVLGKMGLTNAFSDIDERNVQHIVDTVHSYVEDAKHYLQNRPSTALAAISYAEGLLDALRLLGLAKFEWPDARDDES